MNYSKVEKGKPLKFDVAFWNPTDRESIAEWVKSRPTISGYHTYPVCSIEVTSGSTFIGVIVLSATENPRRIELSSSMTVSKTTERWITQAFKKTLKSSPYTKPTRDVSMAIRDILKSESR